MPKDKIKDLIHAKKDLQKQLIKMFKKYYFKFIDRLYVNSLREFQEKLLKIPTWPEAKIEKEYQKFLSFMNDRYNLTELQLINMLQTIYTLNIQILTSLCDELPINPPKLYVFWYKCLKYIAKYYFEHPKVLLSNIEFEETKPIIESHLHHMILKFISLKDIINSKQKPPCDKYNFDDYTTNSSHSNKSITNSLPTLEQNDNMSLKYLSSNNFEDEYYESEKEEQEQENLDEKHIVLPIQNKKHKLGKTKTQQIKNNLDEHFFDDL